MESLGTRFHTAKSGIAFPAKLADLYKSYIPNDRKDVSVSLVDVSKSEQDNVVVRIRGSEYPSEVIILGSHIDSVASGRGGHAPGGDDDASGTSINLEIFRVMMENEIFPSRTIEFHGYAAEEVGLVGSGELAADYKKQNIDVKAMVQFDLALYTGRRGLKLDTLYFVKNNTNAELNSDLISLAQGYLEVSTVLKNLFGGNSDHYSWTRNGFPAALPTENPSDYNRKIHTKSDTLDALEEGSIGFAELYAKLGLSYVYHYGGVAN